MAAKQQVRQQIEQIGEYNGLVFSIRLSRCPASLGHCSRCNSRRATPDHFAPHSGSQNRETYECGMDTIGSAWVRFDISYYLFALIFVAFEVDVLYILPIAVIYDTGTYVWRDFIELTIFIGILFLAIIYAWSKGVLHWRHR